MPEKYMLLCVAGQSNAVGFDESPVPPDYCAWADRDRIRQLGVHGEGNLKIIPLGALSPLESEDVRRDPARYRFQRGKRHGRHHRDAGGAFWQRRIRKGRRAARGGEDGGKAGGTR